MGGYNMGVGLTLGGSVVVLTILVQRIISKFSFINHNKTIRVRPLGQELILTDDFK